MRPRVLRHLISSSPGALLVLLVTSCSNPHDDRLPTFPVSGEVVVGDHAAAGALLVLHPQSGGANAPRPRGRVQSDGSFRVGTYEEADGAPAGAYFVTVLWAEPPAGPMADPDMGPDRLKGRYSDPQRSGLRATVGEGDNQLATFRLSR